MKKFALVTSLLFGLSTVVAFGQASTPSQQPDQSQPSMSGQQQPGSAYPQSQSQQPSSSQTPASSSDAQTAVQKALQQDTTLSGVSAQSGSDNKLVLTGTVPTKEDKHRAEQLARSAAGGMSIDNKIQVSGSSSTPGAMGGSTSGNPPPQGSTGANPPPPQGNSFLSSDAQYGSQTPDQGTAGQSSAGQTGQAGSQSSTGSQNPSSMSSGQGMGTQGQGASAQIQSALQQQPALSGVTVNETDSQIELSGNVAKSSDKKDAKKIAEQHAGGKKVVDKITVGQSK